jgi:thioester reductase-like protein
MACGERTIPGTIDHIASKTPEKIWARYPATADDFQAGILQNVTFASLANAINNTAWLLDAAFPQREPLDTLAYCGPSDIRYYIIACAACKCSMKVKVTLCNFKGRNVTNSFQALFSSPRNNLDAHLSLVDENHCTVLLHPRKYSFDDNMNAVLRTRELRIVEVPPLLELFAESHPFPWQDDFTFLSDKPFITLHTSGSTGLPKSVDVTHGLIATIDAQQLLSKINGRSVSAVEWAGRSVYTGLPPFHSAGFNFFSYSVFQETQLILGPSDQPPSLGVVEQVLNLDIASAAVMAPSLLIEVAADDAVLAKVSRWSSVTFGGGPLPQHAGNALWDQTRVLQILGSTETFNIPELIPATKDEWSYHDFHPALGIRFNPQDDDLHELTFVRDPAVRKHQGAFWTFPDSGQYSMKDIYKRHPSKPDLWMYNGRIDDTIVLANGEKFTPNTAESVMSQNPYVKAAMIVGSGYTQPALLLEPIKQPDEASLAEWHDSIMQTAEVANSTLPAHAQIHKSHTKLLDTPNIFLRSSKGEPQRFPTTKSLSHVIEAIMNSAHCDVEDQYLNFACESALTQTITSVVSSQAFAGRHLPQNADIFQCGFDSLKVMKLLRHIRASLKNQELHLSSDLTPKVIYQNPSPETLSRGLLALLCASGSEATESDQPGDYLAQLRARYSSRIRELRDDFDTGFTVLLTGSTGSLGSYLLDKMMHNPGIDRVICLNRAGSDENRQSGIQSSRGLQTDFAKVDFLEADLSQEGFGLDCETYTSLKARATHIIHNAWPVNFNLPLSSFEPQLEACCRLLAFARSSHNFKELMFLSSVGVANDWSNHFGEDVPEQPIENTLVAEDMGYAQSKLLAEQLLQQGAQEMNVPVTICRLGQIAGPVESEQGSWNRNEWFPSLILSCKALGKMPRTLGAMECMDWIPVDRLANMLVEVLSPDDRGNERGSHKGARYLHFVNPQRPRWSEIACSVVASIDRDIEIVPFDQWVSCLAAVIEKDDEAVAVDIPALKLVDFYQHIGKECTTRPVFSTDVAQERSASLRNLPEVSLQWIQQWLRQWGQWAEHETKSSRDLKL